MGKVIFHIDMNCFFVSCEVAENPELKGQNVAVGHVGLDRKGMILAASYEAKAYGIKTTMPIFEAERLCPNLILINPNHELFNAIEKAYENDPETLKSYAKLLLNQALLIEGFPLKDPVEFSKKMCLVSVLLRYLKMKEFPQYTML